MCSLFNKKLQNILEQAINDKEFSKAQESVLHLKQLASIEKFVAGEEFSNRDPSTHLLMEESEPILHTSESEQMIIYYLEEEGLFKFKKSPQTYTSKVDFFEVYLKSLETWKKKSSFSAKEFYEQFYGELQPLIYYNPSTLRQFITFLFRFSCELKVLEKTDYHQRSRVIVNKDFNPKMILERIKAEKIVRL